MITSVSEFKQRLQSIQQNSSVVYTTLPSSEPRLIIDANSREISIPVEFDFLAVKKDHKAETIYFEIDRYFDDNDLSEQTCVIQWTNQGDEGVSPCTKMDIETFEGKIIFGWEITSDCTRHAGNISFSVRFYTIDEIGNFEYNFNTLPATSKVLDTLDSYGDKDPVNPSTFQVWVDKLYFLDKSFEELKEYGGIEGPKGEDGQTPYIKDGYWYIGDDNTGVKAKGIDGADGKNGKDGADGANGKDGVDGKTPYIQDGYWYIDGVNTEVKAEGAAGKDGVTPTMEISADGYWIINGVPTEHKAVGENGKDGATGADGQNGTDGKDGVSITQSEINSDGELVLTYSDGNVVNVGKVVGANGQNGTNGVDGKDGQDGADGQDGVGISNVLVNTSGNLWVILSNGTTIECGKVTGTDGKDGANGAAGKDGVDGLTPYIKDGYWWIGETNTGVKAEAVDGTNGADGKDGADGITPEFTVENGELKVSYNKGEAWTSLGYIQGADGADGKDGINGVDGTNGTDGKDGKDGKDGDSAYQTWLNAGHSGSEEDFLQWLKGDTEPFGDVITSIAYDGIPAGTSLNGKTIKDVLVMLLGIKDKPKPATEVIMNNRLPSYSGLDGEESSEIIYKELDTATAAYTDQGFYTTTNAEGEITNAGYQMAFEGNDEGIAQTFAIYSDAKIVAAYQYQPALNQWLSMGFDGTYWIANGTETKMINGQEITYTTYAYNAELLGETMTAQEYWRFEVEVL